MSAEFEIDGYEFELRTLALPDACKGVKLVGQLQSVAGTGDVVAAITAAVGDLPALLDLFAPHCTVKHPNVGAGRKVALKTFKSEVFDGHLDRALLFAANCAAAEFGDFLGAGLERLGAGLAELAQRYPALKGQSPTSGD